MFGGISLEDTWRDMPPPEVVAATLVDWGVWDEGLTEDEARHRYARFQGVDFGVAPREEWPRLRRDLLPFEEHLASQQHDVGLVKEFPFKLTPKAKARGVHQKPTPLNKERREWVAREFEALLKSGVVKRAPTAICTSKVVLVEEG